VRVALVNLLLVKFCFRTKNGTETTPKITLVDNTDLSPDETAREIDEIIRLNMV